MYKCIIGAGILYCCAILIPWFHTLVRDVLMILAVKVQYNSIGITNMKLCMLHAGLLEMHVCVYTVASLPGLVRPSLEITCTKYQNTQYVCVCVCMVHFLLFSCSSSFHWYSVHWDWQSCTNIMDEALTIPIPFKIHHCLLVPIFVGLIL